ncbi:comEC family competence protein [bacterium BMS3Bbin11]|nr:comEC family competence protein [bacterium BMS3Abin11]GBE45325.1 comEC family competence protein [bacterium BMS3Bbin11]HDH16249.1 DNA internalization-related competence protein ComEC/Rec2 [Gammaproteobacteria bacterium]
MNFSPLPLTAFAFLLGIVALFFLPDLSPVHFAAGLLPAALIALLWLKKWRLTVLFFLAGFFYAALVAGNQLTRILPQSQAGKTIQLDGIVEGLPDRQGRVVRFNFNVFHSSSIDGRAIRGRIRVSDYRKKTIDPQPGEAWRLLLRAKSPHGFANPAGFDYEKWLFSQRIIATAYIRKNVRKNKAKRPEVNHRLPDMDRSAVIDRMRLRIAAQIKKSLPDSSFRGIITALATGDRRAITSQQWSVLQTTGTSHLMAISGLHVGLVAGIAFFLFRFLFATVPQLPLLIPSHKAAAVVAMSCATFYSLMAGFSLPTQRALLMLTVLMVAIILRRRVRALDILSLTLLLVLILDPLSILSAGFWLSFAAVAMILYILQQRSHRNDWTESSTFKTVNMQLKLSLMMAPATLIFFQQIPLSGPVANLVAIPVVAFLIVPLVLLASLSFLLFGGGFVEHNLYRLADYVLQLLWTLLESLARATEALPFSVEHSAVALAGLVFTILVLMLPAGLKIRKLALVGLLAFFFPLHSQLREGEFRVILLDVGQGLSAVIMTGRHALLFDTGARFSKRFNAGDAVVLPVLKSLSINRLDTLIVSHGDNDHSGGVQKVLAGMEVKQVITNEKIIDTGDGTKVTPCRAGLQWQWEGVSFRILHPDTDGTTMSNNASCVLHVKSSFASILLPADIEEEAEKEIISRYPDTLRSNILIAGHHGSNTSSSDDFINAVSPQLVLFPAGWRNRYHHPAKKVLHRLAIRQIKSMITGECGAITIRVAEAGVSAWSWRQSNRKIWDVSEIDRRCSKVVIGLSEISAF